MDDAKEIKIPAALLAIATAIFLLYGLFAAGTLGVSVMLVALAFQIFVGVAVGLVACLIASKLIGFSLGTLGPTTLKLAAIYTFPAAVGALIPFVGWIIALALFFVLLTWLFELEGREAILCSVIVFVVYMGASIFIQGAVMAAMQA